MPRVRFILPERPHTVETDLDRVPNQGEIVSFEYDPGRYRSGSDCYPPEDQTFLVSRVRTAMECLGKDLGADLWKTVYIVGLKAP